MSSFIFKKIPNGYLLENEGRAVLTIPCPDDCTDSFEALEPGAWRWTRRAARPVTEMRMEVRAAYKPRYWLVPSVNYNGNGWGSGAQYSGWADQDGTPWTYAWHRVAVPACTYSEDERFAVSLFGEEKGGMSCTIYPDGEETVQALLWPEQEGPRVLFKRFWKGPYKGTMEPQDTFTALLFAAPAAEKRERYHDLLDFAFRYFDRPLRMEKSPEEIIRLDTLWFRSLWHKQFDGVTGFASGMNWDESAAAYVKNLNSFEIGWVGQNASVACSLLREYLKTGDTDLRDKAISVLDSWVRYAVLDNGLMLVNLKSDPKRLDSVINGDIPVDLDACNLGTAAVYFFKAVKLAEKCGVSRPEYAKTALSLCDFALRVQAESGEFAKTWFLDGSVNSVHGSVGAFMILPLFDAFDFTGERKYLDCALKATDFYDDEFLRCGYTTAGALDSYCIDKESAAPMLRAACRAYRITGEKKYAKAAEEIGYYLATWQWHYTETFPDGSLAAQIHFDTYGCTSVSAAHNALDFYGLYYVPEYLELAKITGNELWTKRARALWYNGIQLISDGTLVINSRVRPAGSQDESIRHTRWGRPDGRYFIPSEWLVNWSGSFRQVTLDMLDDWNILR